MQICMQRLAKSMQPKCNAWDNISQNWALKVKTFYTKLEYKCQIMQHMTSHDACAIAYCTVSCTILKIIVNSIRCTALVFICWKCHHFCYFFVIYSSSVSVNFTGCMKSSSNRLISWKQSLCLQRLFGYLHLQVS